jgi:hypothetical protein
MKRIVFLTCIGSLALALTAWGAPNNKTAHKSAKKAKGAASAQTVSAKGGRHVVSHARTTSTSRGVSAARVRSPRTATASERIGARRNVTVNRERNISRASTLRSSRVEAARVRSARTATANARIGARSGVALNREGNLNRANTLRTNRVEAARMHSARTANANARIGVRSNVAASREINVRIVNNWRSDRFRGQNYAAFRDYRRQWHDRTWWRNHYSRIIFVSGGWWYWNTGYWYPAWGYDRSYTYYPYDGPIYGYGDLTPDQVIVNVQIQLQRDGYYAGTVDGILGPQTRGAIAAFQADHGLAITSAVDQPTLATLGLT